MRGTGTVRVPLHAASVEVSGDLTLLCDVTDADDLRLVRNAVLGPVGWQGKAEPVGERYEVVWREILSAQQGARVAMHVVTQCFVVAAAR